MEIKTGGQAAAQALIDHGVEIIFTLCGGHLNPIQFHLVDSGRVKFFDTRHEQAAVWMAEAYGRFKRKPGVAMVTAGPGFTNSLTPIASARMASTPLVLISGAVGINMMDKLDLQDMRQAPVIEPMVKKAFICHHADRAAEYVDMAFREASSGRPGPVYLELPVDVLASPLKEGGPVLLPQTNVSQSVVDLEKTAQLLALINQAQKPILIVGSGGWYSDAGEDLSRLAENTGLPVFAQAGGRGVVSDFHPCGFGAISGIRPGAGLHASQNADLIVILGSRLNLFTLFGQIFNPAAKMVQVDIMPEEIGRNKQIDLPIMSDIKALAKQLDLLAAQSGDAPKLKEKFDPWRRELKAVEAKNMEEAQKLWQSDAVPIHPMRLAWEVDRLLDKDDDILITDGGDATTWMGMSRTFRQAGHYLDYGLFGCIGGGIPYAVCAKTLYPEKRVLAISGDGSIGFNFMEFERAVTKNIPIVVVLFNDLGWGMIRHSQEVRLGRALTGLTDLGRIDYHKFVESMGGYGLLVEKPADIRPAIEAAYASGKVSLVNVMTDPKAISPGSIALANVGAYK